MTSTAARAPRLPSSASATRVPRRERTSPNSAATKNPFSTTSTSTANSRRMLMRQAGSGASRARRYFGRSRRRSSGDATMLPDPQALDTGGEVVIGLVPAPAVPSSRRSLISSFPMRIVSLVPSATEMLFALGLGDEVAAVTHECDHPPEVLDLPRVTRDVIGAGLAPAEIDRAVRALTEEGRAIYELDEPRLRALQPDLIVTQALCAVCAVSYDDVLALADGMDPRPEVISLDPHTVGEMLGDMRTLAEATGSRDAGVDLVQDAAGRIDRVRLAV